MEANWRLDNEVNHALGLFCRLETCVDPLESARLFQEASSCLERLREGGREMTVRVQVARPGMESMLREYGTRQEVLQGRRVLVVDDEQDLLKIVSRMLGRMGCQVVTADNGHKAWQAYSIDPQGFDVVLTDLIMPELDGRQLASRIRGLRADQPVILISGKTHEVEDDPDATALFSRMLAKPLSMSQLQESLAEVLLS